MGEDMAAWEEDRVREEGQASETVDVPWAGGSAGRIETEKSPHRWGKAGECQGDGQEDRPSSSGSGGQESIGGLIESCLVGGGGLYLARSGWRGESETRGAAHSEKSSAAVGGGGRRGPEGQGFISLR